MKTLRYLLGAILLLSGIDSLFITDAGNLHACPRCRRALPKGPKKRPHPGFPKKIIQNNVNDNMKQNTKENLYEKK